MRLPVTSLLALAWVAVESPPAWAANDLGSEMAPLLNLSGTNSIAVGPLFSLESHPDNAVSSLGAGLELAYTHYLGEPASTDPHLIGYGAFLHGEVLGLGTQDIHGYAALGGQLNYLSLGCELGGAMEFLDQSYANTVFIHVAPYFSLGLIWVGFHVDIPMFAFGAGPTYPIGYGIELGGQLPLFIGDRPLVDGVRLRGPFGGG